MVIGQGSYENNLEELGADDGERRPCTDRTHRSAIPAQPFAHKRVELACADMLKLHQFLGRRYELLVEERELRIACGVGHVPLRHQVDLRAERIFAASDLVARKTSLDGAGEDRLRLAHGCYSAASSNRSHGAHHADLRIEV